MSYIAFDCFEQGFQRIRINLSVLTDVMSHPVHLREESHFDDATRFLPRKQTKKPLQAGTS